MKTRRLALKTAMMAVMAMTLAGCGRNSASMNESATANANPPENQQAAAPPVTGNAGNASVTTNASVTNSPP